jgi:hypothetical protein
VKFSNVWHCQFSENSFGDWAEEFITCLRQKFAPYWKRFVPFFILIILSNVKFNWKFGLDIWRHPIQIYLKTSFGHLYTYKIVEPNFSLVQGDTQVSRHTFLLIKSYFF